MPIPAQNNYILTCVSDLIWISIWIYFIICSSVMYFRCATVDGVMTHSLRAETHRDLAVWAKSLVNGSHASAVTQKELVCSKYIPLCSVLLCINQSQNGFSRWKLRWRKNRENITHNFLLEVDLKFKAVLSCRITIK